LTANPRELPDVQLEDIVLAGARSIGANAALLCAEQQQRYVATNERRLACLGTLLQCAAELDRRHVLRRMAGNLLTSPAGALDYLITHFRGRDTECFVVMFLDAHHRILGVEEMFRGTLTQTSVYPREVVRRALANNAGAVILAHNHPSGIPEPSRADEFLTATLKSALSLVDVRVLDHVIVGADQALSMAQRGLV
jgi:DNA repair protein RadC